MRRRTLLAGSLASLPFSGLALAALRHASRNPASAEAADGRRIVRGAATAFGTTVGILALSDRPETARAAIDRALRETQRIDATMSLHRPDSQLVRLNRDAVLLAPDPHLRRNLEFALQLAAASKGAFDPTIQPLWTLYADCRRRQRLPCGAEIVAARGGIDWSAVEVGARRIRLRRGAALTLNAVAQGYATDVALLVLADAGVHDALIDTGEFGAVGSRPGGDPWTLGLQHPRDPDAMIAAIRMDGRFLATSGDYSTTFSADFVHHHVIDPRSGVSPTGFSCVAVAATSGLVADGLATALMLVDRERGLALLRGYPGADAVWVDKRCRVEASAGMPLVRV